MCGPLCDAVLLAPKGASQATLEYIERANLFAIPLDKERRWYRYHHLFAELLRQRLHKAASGAALSDAGVAELHQRASQWYEDNDLEIEAFDHAAAANDVERAERLIAGAGMPLTYRGAAGPVLDWLKSLPETVLNARPSLWVTYASALFFTGQPPAVEAKLQSAEAALQAAAATMPSGEPDTEMRDLIGQVASLRATLAVIAHDSDALIKQSRRALEYLRPDNLTVRTATTYTLGYAYQIQGDRAAAMRTYSEVIEAGKAGGNSIYTLAATLGIAQLQEANLQLHQAAESYRRPGRWRVIRRDQWAAMAARQSTLVLGAFLMLLNTAVDIGKGVLFFPILERHGKRTALAYLSALIVQVVFLNLGVLSLLMLAPLSQFAGEGWAAGVGSLLTEANSMAYHIGQATLAGGAAFLSVLLYRARLLPRFLAAWGLVGYIIHAAGAIAEIFGYPVSLVLLVPGMMFELALPLWLIFKGFNKEAYGQD